MARYTWGNMLAERIDRRIAVSPEARASAQRWLGGEYAIVPNGVIVPPQADPANRRDHVVFIGRHEPRKGMHIMLRAWPEIRRRTGARLRLVGADPLAVRLVLTRERVPDEGIDVLGALSNEELTDELLRAKVQVASSLGGESFGMVLTRGLACAVAGRRVGHPRLSRRARGRRRRARARRATTARSRPPSSTCSRTRKRGSGAARRLARSFGALRVGRDRTAAARDLRGSGRLERRVSLAVAARRPRAPRARPAPSRSSGGAVRPGATCPTRSRS